MNRSIVRFLISKLLLIEAGLLIVPLIVALIYHEDAKVFASILGTMGILLFIGVLGTLFKPKNYHIYTKEGMLIVALCWVFWSFFGGLPFVFAGQIPSVIDAFFEMSSGFTTTGATILTDTGVLTHSLLFWRSFAHLIGGMGVLVFALAIMNNSKNGHHEVMRAEVPGPVFGKVVAKLKNTAQILYIIYLVMFVIFAMILWICGMPLFDSIIIAMGGAGTGGFAVYNDSIAHYHSDLITYVVTVGTLLFGVNFNLYFYILLRKVKFSIRIALHFRNFHFEFYRWELICDSPCLYADVAKVMVKIPCSDLHFHHAWCPHVGCALHSLLWPALCWCPVARSALCLYRFLQCKCCLYG